MYYINDNVGRASGVEQTKRLNMAVDLLEKNATPQEVVSSLVLHCGLSPRQAYRYVQQAQQACRPAPLPEKKSIFTVRLPIGLIQQVRRQARDRGEPISDLVKKALRDYLEKSESHG